MPDSPDSFKRSAATCCSHRSLNSFETVRQGFGGVWIGGKVGMGVGINMTVAVGAGEGVGEGEGLGVGLGEA